MGKIKKKFESGAATAYIPRNQAIKKLQLTIADFRRLCILKGVYPVEPKNKKKVNKGSTSNRTFYFAKDINFLANEPIINKFREFKIYVKRLKRAKGRRDIKALGRIRNNKPSYKIDHIVKERYPTFTDAVRDLDDCLSLVFLFAMLPKSKRIYVEKVQLCRRLSLEFMHYVISSKSLRKCFISIKGYYFQADIKGQKVTWIMPHKLAYQTPDDVDFRIMSTFVEFYTVMLGFVNYKTYSDLGLFYPPKLSLTQDDSKSDLYDQEDFTDEYLASLNCDFIKISETDAEQNGDEFLLADEENPAILEKAKIEEDNLKKLKVLFQGLKFFLNREVPREQFVLAIRSFSGEVSWDKTVGLGSTYQEDDQSITHQIIDRPIVGKQQFNRVYVQPQWVFDCINENTLLPVNDYLPGAILPPHLSPFIDAKEGDYVPPEKQRLINMKLGIVDEEVDKKVELAKKATEEVLKDQKTDKKGNKNDKTKKNGSDKTKAPTKENDKRKGGSDNDDDDEEDDDLDASDDEVINDMKVDIDSPDEDESNDEEDEPEEESEDEKEKKANKPKPAIMVVKGKPKTENVNMTLKKQMDEEKKLSEMMIPKKQKRLYDRIVHSQKKQRREVEVLAEKRKRFEESSKKPTNKT